MAVKIAVYGEANLKQIERARKELNRLESDVKKNAGGFKGSMAKMQTSVAAIGPTALAAAAGIGIMVKETTDAASNLAESQSKVNVVFGQSSVTVQQWADDAAQAMGMSERAALEAAGTYGNLFRAIGLTEQESSKMSMTLTGLAADLASFNNATIDDALLALRSGLTGETEPLKKFGVNLNEARLKEEALRQGLVKTAKGTLPAAAKAQAAYSLILQDTALAQGDFARTSDGLANKQRILAATFEDSKAALGEELLPTMINATTVATDMLKSYSDLDAGSKGLTNTLVATGGGAAIAAKMFGPWGAAIVAAAGAAYGLGQTLSGPLVDSITNVVTDGGDLKTMYYLSTSGAKDATAATKANAQANNEAADAAGENAQETERLVRALNGQMVAEDSLEGKLRTAKEATLDLKQAKLDAKQAETDYTAAVKEHGAKSDEAKRAAITLARAELRVKDAAVDAAAAVKDIPTTKTVKIKVKFSGSGDIDRVVVNGKLSGFRVNAAGGIFNKPEMGVYGEASPRYGEYIINKDRAMAGDSRQLGLISSLLKGLPSGSSGPHFDFRGAVFGSGLTERQVWSWMDSWAKNQVRSGGNYSFGRG